MNQKPQRLSRLLEIVLLIAIGYQAACGGETLDPTLTSLIALGTAHAEIEQWEDARKTFQQARELDPQEPVVAFNLAVVDFRTSNGSAARGWLEQARPGAPPELAARIELLRARLAYEAGNEAEEIEAHHEAVRLEPREAAYAHALAQLYLRLGRVTERGRFLEQAHQLWPDNAYLAAELALWLLEQPDEAVRRRGLSTLEPLVGPGSGSGTGTGSGSEIVKYLEKGRHELSGTLRVPSSLRIAVNLLRGTKRFQSNATEVQARLEPTPLLMPILNNDSTNRILIQPPAVSFTGDPSNPQPDLASGEELVAAVLVDDATPRLGGDSREAGVAILTDQGLYYLPSTAEAFERLGDVPRGTRQLLAGDIDDDEHMELLVLSSTGLRLWKRESPGDASSEWTEVSSQASSGEGLDLRRALLIDFEHDGDLDILAATTDGRLVLSTHRGEAGLGPLLEASLPVDSPIRLLSSVDLDGDSDQDLLLASATELLVLRNWRQGDYGAHARLALPRGEKPIQLLPVDYYADGFMDVVVLLERGFDFWRGGEQALLQRDETARADTALFSDKVRPHRLTAADLDLDGDQDLVVSGSATTLEGAGVVGVFNLGNRRFAARSDLFEEPWPAARGSLVLDLDGDRDPDILTWAEAGLLRSFHSRGAENQRWVALRLRAPARKVPRDGRGVRLQVVAGNTVQWLQPDRPNIILGLGSSEPALIKATWPNGISEYLFEPEVETDHTLELSMRVEGSCPFLFATDGRKLRFVTDILGLAPLGMLAAPGRYVPADPEEYLRLPDWVAPVEVPVEPVDINRGDAGRGPGRHQILELAITEELREVLYLDQAELVAVDAPRNVAVYNGEQWLPEPIHGLALRLMAPLTAPVSVLDDQNREVLTVVQERDEHYLTNHSGPNRYQGAVTPHRLTIELPPQVAASENPALILVGWLHWGNTSTNVARSQDPDGAPMFPFLEVPDKAGGWRRTTAPVGLPAGKTKEVVVDLTGVLEAADPRVRITTDFEVYWDLVAATHLLRQDATPHRIHRLPPQFADLRFSGFSRWFRSASNGPYLFDYHDRRPYPWRLDSDGREIVLSWQELEGYFTPFGPVTDLLTKADDRLAVLGSGEELRLRFDIASLPTLPAGWRRTLFLHSEGWEKDGDPNVSCSRTAEPLPYRGMLQDPCSGRLSAANQPSEDTSRSRWVSRDRLARRVVSRNN